MSKKNLVPLEEIEHELRQDPEYRKAERRLKPYADLVIQMVKRRNELGMTQKDLARKANTHQSRISRIETGEHDIRFSTLIDIAEALECEVVIQLAPVQESGQDISDDEYMPLFTGPVTVRLQEKRAPYKEEG